MTENESTTEFATQEGDQTLEETGDTEDTTSTDSSTENNETDEGQSTEGQQGANTQDDTDDTNDNTPFHEHPRWKEREAEWDNRFNEQERRHQEDMQKLREEFSGARKDNANNTEIPAWFGGTQEQWDAYRADRDKELQQAEERAMKRITEQKEQQDKAVKEATDYMRTELATIEKDKNLNPTGAKIDPKKLLQIVLDNDLVDSQGRWNYRAGMRIYNSQTKPAAQIQQQKTGAKKIVAGATTSENRGEKTTPVVKTSADFKKNKPW